MKKFVIPIIVISIFSIRSAYSQDEIERFAINPKMGMYNSLNKSDGFAYGIEIGIKQNELLYSLDYYRLDEFTLFGPNPSENYNQLGIMIGDYIGEQYWRLQYQAGISMFWGTKRTNVISSGSGWFGGSTYDTENFYTIGLPAKLGFKFVPFRFMAIGIDLQANINLNNPVIMPLISLEFGNLRYKIIK
jgi:hypothetical protein